MSKHRRAVPYFTCSICGKRGYRTEDDAERALSDCRHKASRLRRSGVPGVTRMERRYYQCPWTDFWHLTSVRSLDY